MEKYIKIVLKCNKNRTKNQEQKAQHILLFSNTIIKK